MKRSVLMVGALVVLNLTAGRVFAQVQDTTKKTTTTTTTTAAPADGATDVVGALASNADYSTALADVKAAGLDATLKTGGHIPSSRQTMPRLAHCRLQSLIV